MATPVVVAPAAEPSQPILPPRPTGRSAAAAEPRSAWRHWPMVVIGVAVVAIVGAVAIMMWPSSSEAGKHVLTAPPAPERMDTNPIKPQAQPDPWGGAHGSIQPQAPSPRPMPTPVPDLKDPFDNDDQIDPFSSAHGNGIAGLGGPNALALANAIGKHLCSKLTKCGVSDAAAFCDMAKNVPAPPLPACPAVQRCLDHIDHLSCSDAGDAFSPWNAMQQAQDCIDAMQC